MRRMKCKDVWLLSCACRGDMRSLDIVLCLSRFIYNAINLIWEWRCYSILCYSMKIFRLRKILFRYLERYRDVTKGKYFRNVYNEEKWEQILHDIFKVLFFLLYYIFVIYRCVENLRDDNIENIERQMLNTMKYFGKKMCLQIWIVSKGNNGNIEIWDKYSFK